MYTLVVVTLLDCNDFQPLSLLCPYSPRAMIASGVGSRPYLTSKRFTLGICGILKER